jgi:FkbM family methyltransferase
MSRAPGIARRRVKQTLTAFENGPKVLWDMARGADDLVYQTKVGLKITCPNVAGARVPLYELFAEDTYQMSELVAGLPEDLVVLDIGGQIGCFSTSLAITAPKATVHSYEASPATAVYLEKNIADNGLTGRVHPHTVAVSDHHGTLTFTDAVAGSGLNGMTSPQGQTSIEVPCITFAEAVAEAGGTVHLVKLDVEGAEYPIVLGSNPSDWAGVQRVAMEFHGVPDRHWHELRDFWASAGLNVTKSDFGGPGFGMLWLERN